MTLFEVNQAAAIIRETAHPDVNMIFGAVIDPNMGDEVRCTVIATGFERSGVTRRVLERIPVHQRNLFCGEHHLHPRPSESVTAGTETAFCGCKSQPIQNINNDDLMSRPS